MKQVQIEYCSFKNAVKLRQDIKNATSSSVFENIKESISTDFDINVDTPRKESFNGQKNESKDNINKLNDINAKLSSDNSFPNKCKTINGNLGVNNNKGNSNPLKIKDNKVISKVNNDCSNVSNNNKINDNNNGNSNNDKNNNNNSNNNDNNNNNNNDYINDNNNGNDNNDNNSDNNNNNKNNNRCNINENENNLATNDYGKCNYDITNNKIANNKNKSNLKVNTRKKSV